MDLGAELEATCMIAAYLLLIVLWMILVLNPIHAKLLAIRVPQERSTVDESGAIFVVGVPPLVFPTMILVAVIVVGGIEGMMVGIGAVDCLEFGEIHKLMRYEVLVLLVGV